MASSHVDAMIIADPRRGFRTDGQGGITGALAALASFYTHNQKTETDCGLDFGWNRSNAPRTNPKAVNNIANCAKKGK